MVVDVRSFCSEGLLSWDPTSLKYSHDSVRSFGGSLWGVGYLLTKKNNMQISCNFHMKVMHVMLYSTLCIIYIAKHLHNAFIISGLVDGCSYPTHEWKVLEAKRAGASCSAN